MIAALTNRKLVDPPSPKKNPKEEGEVEAGCDEMEA